MGFISVAKSLKCWCDIREQWAFHVGCYLRIFLTEVEISILSWVHATVYTEKRFALFLLGGFIKMLTWNLFTQNAYRHHWSHSYPCSLGCMTCVSIRQTPNSNSIEGAIRQCNWGLRSGWNTLLKTCCRTNQSVWACRATAGDLKTWRLEQCFLVSVWNHMKPRLT